MPRSSVQVAHAEGIALAILTPVIADIEDRTVVENADFARSLGCLPGLLENDTADDMRQVLPLEQLVQGFELVRARAPLLLRRFL